MATLSTLVQALAWISTLPESKVFAYGRFAREAGLIAQAGRGRQAARMTQRDAANLLIAACGTEITREAARAINTFRPMKGCLWASRTAFEKVVVELLRPLGVKRDKQGLEIQCDFGSVLELLMREAGSGRLLHSLTRMFEIATGKKVKALDPALELVELRLIFDRIDLSARIEFSNRSEGLAGVTFLPDNFLQSKDLYVTATIGYDTLMLIGLVLDDFVTPAELKSWNSWDHFAQALRRHYIASRSTPATGKKNRRQAV